MSKRSNRSRRSKQSPSISPRESKLKKAKVKGKNINVIKASKDEDTIDPHSMSVSSNQGDVSGLHKGLPMAVKKKDEKRKGIMITNEDRDFDKL